MPAAHASFVAERDGIAHRYRHFADGNSVGGRRQTFRAAGYVVGAGRHAGRRHHSYCTLVLSATYLNGRSDADGAARPERAQRDGAVSRACRPPKGGLPHPRAVGSRQGEVYVRTASGGRPRAHRRRAGPSPVARPRLIAALALCASAVLIAHLALISHTPWVGASGATQKPANSGLAGPQQHHADIPGDTTGSRHEEPATPASDPGLGISQVRCVPAGTVRLSTKLTCRWRPVDVVLQVRTGCPSDQATPLGIRSLRITNPLPDAIIPYPTEQGPGAPEGLVPEWVFNAAPAEGITVSHRIQATEVGEFLIGAQGEIVVEDDSGRRITGSLQPETLIVVPACSGPRAATAYFPWLHKPSCKPSRVPADVIVLLDRSGSTGERSIEQAAQQLPVFFEGLVPDRDRLGVIAFDEDAELLVPLGHARADTESTLRGLDLKPGTRLERAIAAGRAELSGPRGRPAARRLMLLVTDGVQTGSAGEQVALAAAESARLRGITLLAMALGPSPDRMLLTRLTGSPRRVVAAPSPSSIGSAYVELADLASCSSAGP